MNFSASLHRFNADNAAHKLGTVEDESAKLAALLGTRTPSRRDPLFDPRPGDVLQDGDEAIHAIVATTPENVWFYALTETGAPGLFCWPRRDWIAHVTDNDPEAPPWTVFACAEECAQQERDRAKRLAELDAKLAARDAEGKS